MVETKQPHVSLFGLFLEPLYREWIYEKAAAALLLVRILGPPHVDDYLDAAVVDTNQRASTLLGVRLSGVVVDPTQVPGAYLERQATPPRSSRRGTCRPRRTGW